MRDSSKSSTHESRSIFQRGLAVHYLLLQLLLLIEPLSLKVYNN